MPTGQDGSQQISWDFQIPLVTNPFMLLDLAKVLAIAFAAMSVLFLLIGICQGDLEHMLPLIGLLGVCDLAIGVVFVFVMLAFYRNRFPCRFTVSSKGVGYEVTATQRRLNTAVFLIGALAGRPGVAGSGLLARSQESELYRGEDIHRVDLFPGRRVVCIRNSWRTLLRVYCTAENYDAVSEMIRSCVERAAPQRVRNMARGRAGRAVLLRRMWWWPAILLSAFVATAQPLLGERFAAVWIAAAALGLSAVFGGAARRLMALAGLLASAAAVAAVVANGLRETSFAGGLIRWNGFHAATDSQDLPFFIIGCIGIGGLLLIALRLLVIRPRD